MLLGLLVLVGRSVLAHVRVDLPSVCGLCGLCGWMCICCVSGL